MLATQQFYNSDSKNW